MPQITATPIPIGRANWKQPKMGAKIDKGISKRKKPVNSTPSERTMIELRTMPITQVVRKAPMHEVNLGFLIKMLIKTAMIPPITAEKKQMVIPESPAGI